MFPRSKVPSLAIPRTSGPRNIDDFIMDTDYDMKSFNTISSVMKNIENMNNGEELLSLRENYTKMAEIQVILANKIFGAMSGVEYHGGKSRNHNRRTKHKTTKRNRK